ncbi:MAG: hypothetical protein HOW73_12735 [Polyangiaceae bacterium]|nr:hypothetical protein [Polyangiaceae bacterium]
MRSFAGIGLAACLLAFACDDTTEPDGAPNGGGGSSSNAPPNGGGGNASTGGSDGTGGTPSTSDGGGGSEPVCSIPTTPCTDTAECCEGYTCGETSLGQVCCGETGAACNTPNGEDCCGALLCINGTCGLPPEPCESPCKQPPALVIEKQRLANIGGSFLGICGDANHTYGYHLPAALLPGDDYSMEGAANDPVCEWYASAIDIGMDWPVSRDWLAWLIESIRNDDIQGVAEVIGSYDGVDVRYWSDSAGWDQNGIPYQGDGHDSWTHVSIYRSTALEDHGILAGWTANAGP